MRSTKSRRNLSFIVEQKQMIFLRWLLVVDRLLFKKFKNTEINALKIQYLWQSINKVFIERNFRRFQPLPT